MSRSVLEQFVEKLERRQGLPFRDREALLKLHGQLRDHAAGSRVVASGQPSTHCVWLGEGLVSRQKRLANGTCQIVAIHLPGDAVDLQSMLFVDADHDIRAHSPVRALWVSYDQIFELCETHPVLAKALWFDCLADASIFREWTANVGQRNARERLAHFLSEMGARYEAIGQLRDGMFELSLSQKDMASALGLSLVHINKSLKTLRDANLIHVQGRRFTFVDRPALERLAGFTNEYLHLDGRRAKRLDASPFEVIEMLKA